MITKITINNIEVRNGSKITVAPGVYSVKIDRDFKDYPRVRFGDVDIKSVGDAGASWLITVPNGPMQLLITHWDKSKQIEDARIEVTVVGATVVIQKPTPNLIKLIGVCQIQRFNPDDIIIQANGTKKTYYDTLRAVGINSGSVWGYDQKTVATVKKWTALGFVMVVNTGCPGGFVTPAQATTMGTAFVAAYKDVKGVVAEFWNEFNHTFWTGTVQQYVEALNAFYDVVHSAGIRVISGGLVGGIRCLEFVAQLVKFGAKFDYLGLHPYMASVEAADTLVNNIIAMIPDVMIMCTELNGWPWGCQIRIGVDPTHPKSVAGKEKGYTAATPIEVAPKVKYLWQWARAKSAIVGQFYYVVEDQGSGQHKWEHSTGPLCLIERAPEGARTTVYYESLR